MREPILKAVAMPPKIFWAPFLPSLVNLMIQFPFMFICMGVFDMNPLVSVIPIVIVHIVLIIYGSREPHLSAMVRAFGPMAGGSKNIYKSKGTKLAP
ncbi:MAG: hypothetical protein ACI4TE_07080 [Alphaproteobacteria bacterium]